MSVLPSETPRNAAVHGHRETARRSRASREHITARGPRSRSTRPAALHRRAAAVSRQPPPLPSRRPPAARRHRVPKRLVVVGWLREHGLDRYRGNDSRRVGRHARAPRWAGHDCMRRPDPLLRRDRASARWRETAAKHPISIKSNCQISQIREKINRLNFRTITKNSHKNHPEPDANQRSEKHQNPTFSGLLSHQINLPFHNTFLLHHSALETAN